MISWCLRIEFSDLFNTHIFIFKNTGFCRELVQSGKDIESAYWELVVKDIQDACKLFEPIYDQTDGGDGYVSVEVSPRLADNTEGTIEAAKYLHKVVDRPNVYIKISS